MATISFDRDIVVTNQKAIEKIVDGLVDEKIGSKNPNIEIDKELKRGAELLKKLSFQLKK